ncbi:hypothetical protein NECAME_05456 [Necator americanus]|uniref:Uncharacterized protein n=1 Tax=Necator americanus TaxID=51031 RepID=W2SGV0_NECAM|nr:hypothetical protein NECAME_05456 [Necator americanus]ETN68864.1 hypothetical protein NECAME_05456 [Necator americanus]
MCGDKPAAGPDPDLLVQRFTAAKGEFTLKGSESATTNIDTVLRGHATVEELVKSTQEYGKEHRLFQTTYDPNRTSAYQKIFVAYAPTSYHEEEDGKAFYMDVEKFYREDHTFYN